jgi:1,6-anhydro-N-acetylmuramate kinase
LSDYITGLISGIAIALIAYGIWQERRLASQRETLSAELKKMLEDLSTVHNTAAERMAVMEKHVEELRIRADMAAAKKVAPKGFGVMGV